MNHRKECPKKAMKSNSMKQHYTLRDPRSFQPSSASFQGASKDYVIDNQHKELTQTKLLKKKSQ